MSDKVVSDRFLSNSRSVPQSVYHAHSRLENNVAGPLSSLGRVNGKWEIKAEPPLEMTT